MTIDRESEAYREAIEVMTRVEKEHRFHRWSVGADGSWVTSCIACGQRVEALDWRSDGEEVMREHRAEAALDAILAPSRVSCTTCGGTRRDREWRCGCGRGVRHMRDCGRPAPDVPCPDCRPDGTVEGPPVIHRVLGMEQVGWLYEVPGIRSWRSLEEGPARLSTSHPRHWEPIYRASDTRGPK